MDQIDATTIVRVEADTLSPKLVQATSGTVTYGTTTSLGTSLTNGVTLRITTANYFSGGKIAVTNAPVLLADRDLSQAGMYAIAPGMASVATALTASRAYLTRFVPSRPMVIVKIGFACTTVAGADDEVDAGIYDSAGTRLVSAGITTGKLLAQGAKTVTVTATPLQAGTVYYAAFSSGTQGGTAGQVAMNTYAGSGASNNTALFGAGFPTEEALFKAASHPLPTSLASLTAAGATPLLALRET